MGHSCAVFGPPRVSAPCDEHFEALLPAIQVGEGLEIIGKVRMELDAYRIRGILRITYAPREHAARIDFRQSSLFGALEEDVTILIGDSLGMYDRESGRYLANDSSLSLVEERLGERITPEEILCVLLFDLPRCVDLRAAAVTHAGADWELKALWNNRRIEMHGDANAGLSEFRQCYAGEGDWYIVTYGPALTAWNVRYPAWVRLSKRNGGGKAIIELIEIREVALSAPIFEVGHLEER